MENASNALVIAGGILLAIIIMSSAIFVWQNSGEFINQEQTEKEIERIKTFNQEYESYQRQNLRGTDIITVINKIRNNNVKNADNPELLISWEVELVQDFTDSNNRVFLEKGKHTEEKSNQKINQLFNSSDELKSFKSLYFKCEGLEYNENNGRVNKIIFKEYQTSELFGNNNTN